MPAVNEIVAVFGNRSECTTATVYQYNYGERLRIVKDGLPEHYRVDFANSVSGQSKSMLGGADGVLIPYEYFTTGSYIHAWIVLTGEDYAVTRYHITIPISPRSVPTEEQPSPEQESIIGHAIAALNEAVAQTAEDVVTSGANAERAETAAINAEGYLADTIAAKDAAQAAQQGAETAEANAEASASNAVQSADNASGYANQASQSATNAEQSKVAAIASASQAAQSATMAAGSATDAANSASAANASSQAAQTAREGAETAEINASDSASTAGVSASQAAQSAQQAASSALAAGTAKTDAETAKSGAETSESNAAASAEAAAQSAADIAELGESVAKEITAQDILDETKTISDNLNELVEINRSIRYYSELPLEGTEGYTYITPDGIFHYENGEYTQVSGGGGLNGFSLSKDEENRVVLSYVNPEDETDTDSAVMATGATGNAIVTELQSINASLYRMIPSGE